MKKIMALVVGVMLLCMTACGDSIPKSNKSDWAYIEERGTIIVGYDNKFAPMGFQETSGCSKKDVGFDLDLAVAVCEQLGIKIKLMAIDWNSKEIELKAKNIDLIWNGFTITEERRKNITFSVPYLKNEQVIVVRTADVTKYTNSASLAGKSLVAQAGSSALDAIKDNDSLKSNKVTELPDNVAVLNELTARNCEAAVMDSVVANYYTKKDAFKDKVTVLKEVLADEEYGIGIRLNETALKTKIDGALVALKNSGKLAEIADKWGLKSLLLV